jgi:hypothetical protein
MASNPTIESVPPHLRSLPDRNAHIHKYLTNLDPFLRRFIVQGREHIDRCLIRDRKREETRKNKEDEQGTGDGSSDWEKSTVSAIRKVGIVKRMERKDGSRLGDEPDGRKRSDAGSELGTVVFDVLKRSEVGHTIRPKQSRTRDLGRARTREADKENERPVDKVKRRRRKYDDLGDDLGDHEMVDKLIDGLGSRSKPKPNPQKPMDEDRMWTSKNVGRGQEVEEETTSLTSSAQREYIGTVHPHRT